MFQKWLALLAIALLASSFQTNVRADIITDGSFDSAINTNDHTSGEFDSRDTLAWYSGGTNGPDSNNFFLEFKNNQNRGAWQVIDDSQSTVGHHEFSFDYQLLNSNGNLDYSIRIYGFNDPSPSTSFGGDTVNNGAAASAWSGVGGTLLTQIETGDLASTSSFSGFNRSVDFGSGYDYILIGFFAADANGANQLNFDNVSITSAIPEPVASLILPFVLLGVSRVRRRANS